MKLFFSDGTPAIAYVSLSSNPNPSYVLVYLQGGGYCFNSGSCNLRSSQAPQLMSSQDRYHPATKSVSGMFEDPNADVYYVVYCSSDSFSGNIQNVSSSSPWLFEGSTIVRGAFTSGFVDLSRSSTLLFAGSSVRIPDSSFVSSSSSSRN